MRTGLPAMAWLLVLGLAAPARGAVRPQDNPEVQRLEAALKSTANRDSVRFLLAQAYRGTGTVEGRQRALDLFEKLRPAYYRRADYHLEIARTYIEAGRISEARDELDRARRQDPTNVRACLDSGRLLLPGVLRYVDPGMVRQGLASVDQALSLEPENRDALLLKSLYLCLLRDLDPASAADADVVGRACAEKILQRDAQDAPAHLLAAVHALNLADVAAADAEFRLGLAAAGPELRAAYTTPTYSAPESLLARVDGLPPAERTVAITAYWDRIDPTPLTPINEALLEYWKRMTLADLYYGDPEAHRRGWQTPRGETLVRYGRPRTIRFLAGGFGNLESDHSQDESLDRRFFSRFLPDLLGPVSVPLRLPTQSWEYTVGGETIQLAFVDAGLNGRFLPAAPGLLQSLAHAVPSAPLGAIGGDVRHCFVAGAGVRGEEGRTRQWVYVGVPRWSRDPDWWKQASVRVRLLSSTGEASTLLNGELTAPEIQRPVEGGEMAILAADASVRPGRYTVAVDFRQKREGSFVAPLIVRRFDGDSLQISDLRLQRSSVGAAGGAGGEAGGGGVGGGGGHGDGAGEAGSTPDPGGLALPDSRLQVLFELYNLTLDLSGHARYRFRSTVEPRAYERAHPEERESGGARPDSEAGPGPSADGSEAVALTPRSYKDALFPVNEVALAPGATGHCAFALDLGGLREGDYALIVSVTDEVSGRQVRDRIPLQVMTEDDLRLLLRGR